jgi:hypothetical protein
MTDATTRFWRGMALALVFFGATVALQILSRAYYAEFSGYPDVSTQLREEPDVPGFYYQPALHRADQVRQ